VLAVSDAGSGIAPEHLPKLFEAFFTTKKDGLGLGLAIAQSIVEAHHGKISAENHGGAGATFYVALPALAA
jgi:signal transduction histidine kinase